MNEKRICRTCLLELDPNEARSLFAAGKIMGKILNLAQVLISFANLKIARNDGLPQEICLQCIHQISRAYSFKTQSEKNQQILYKRAQNTLPVVTTNYVLENPLDIIPINKSEATSSHEDNNLDGDDRLRSEIPESSSSQNMESSKKSLISPVLSLKPQVKLNTTTLKSLMSPRILYKCKICGKTFSSEFKIKNHRRQEHFSKIYDCELCGKIFKNEELFKRHINVHKTGKPLQCETCGKAFTQKACYVAHLYSHTGERPFLCTHCGKGFKRNSELIIHMRSHLDLRPYKCKICGKRYRTSSIFAIHKRSHSGERPFACKYCDKKFRSTSCLKSHTLIHTGEKPYSCEYCGRGFIKSHTLTVHKRIHTQERPHVCTICGKDFNQAVCLRTHMKIHETAEILQSE